MANMQLCGFEVGLDRPFFLIAGPCVIESEQLALDTAGELKAMTERLGDDADEVMKVLTRHGVTRQLGKEALQLAREQGAFTIFALVDALTRIAGRLRHAGDRSEVDHKASSLLALAK